jgi:hypothetical protein
MAGAAMSDVFELGPREAVGVELAIEFGRVDCDRPPTNFL